MGAELVASATRDDVSHVTVSDDYGALPFAVSLRSPEHHDRKEG
ncbi:MAG: hypothetical protein M0Z95_20745 [Actinomycetota bacterium]|nr:hypothetical protein [Actinomycetota bacterium]